MIWQDHEGPHSIFHILVKKYVVPRVQLDLFRRVLIAKLSSAVGSLNYSGARLTTELGCGE